MAAKRKTDVRDMTLEQLDRQIHSCASECYRELEWPIFRVRAHEALSALMTAYMEMNSRGIQLSLPFSPDHPSRELID
jgi:hypothetical protein